MTWINKRKFEARDAKIIELWNIGRTARQIASILKLDSKNVAIGVVKRARDRGDPILDVNEQDRVRRSADAWGCVKMPERETRSRAPMSESVPHPKGGGVQLDKLGKHECHFPLGNPGDKDFRFCGRPVEPGKVYCPSCCARAYRRVGDNNAAEFVER